jgi:hypothetical protein
MRKMSRAKDFREVLRIQVDFAQAQFNAFSGQASDLSEILSSGSSSMIRAK